MDLPLHQAITGEVMPTRFQTGQTYIFFGQSGQGKKSAALRLARLRNCQGDETGLCASCQAFEYGTSPDLQLVVPDGLSIGIEQVRGLHQALSLSPHRLDSSRFVVIDDAELLTNEAQNALLKLIEEPPPLTTVILVTSQLESLLPTVRSRGRSLYFPPLADDQIQQWLGDRGHQALAPMVTPLAQGAPGLALRLAEDKSLRELYTRLAEVADQLLTAPLFERLLLIKDLDLEPRQLQILTTCLVLRARQLTVKEPSQALVKVEQLFHHLRAGVSSRPALEAVALGV